MGKTDKSMDAGDVLTVALAKERAAYRFYGNLESRLKTPDFLFDLVTKLKNEEAKHMRLIQKELERMNR